MTLRCAQAWVWWLLPFLVARALVPVGFMAQPVEGSFRLVFCGAGYAQPQASDTDGVTSADHGLTHDQSQSDFSCPFGSTAAAPLLDTRGSDAIVFIPDAEILPPAESPYYASGPPRFLATRGPPALS